MVTVYSFGSSKWHFCDGSLPCHSYFDVRAGNVTAMRVPLPSFSSRPPEQYAKLDDLSSVRTSSMLSLESFGGIMVEEKVRLPAIVFGVFVVTCRCSR